MQCVNCCPSNEFNFLLKLIFLLFFIMHILYIKKIVNNMKSYNCYFGESADKLK